MKVMALTRRARRVISSKLSHHFTPIRNIGSGFGSDHDGDGRRGQNPPTPIPNRPLRGDRPPRGGGEEGGRLETSPFNNDKRSQFQNRFPRGGGGGEGGRGGRGRREGPPRPDHSISSKLDIGFGSSNDEDDNDNSMEHQSSPFLTSSTGKPTREKGKDEAGQSFLEKFKLGFEGKESEQTAPSIQPERERAPSPPQDADEIFKKMKETGLIPNAVAMLDGLCKDGLVQEAMKLFGVMREKGTIPEVVIYTAVVEGFCKAHKYEDAKRIFRKMQNNGITPNAFSYTVLIQGLCEGKNLEDAVEFSIEMLEAGHSPNVATFINLVDGFCKDKGVEEANKLVKLLKEKKFFVTDKAVRDHLDKKGPFSPLVGEVVFGKKAPQRLF